MHNTHAPPPRIIYRKITGVVPHVSIPLALLSPLSDPHHPHSFITFTPFFLVCFVVVFWVDLGPANSFPLASPTSYTTLPVSFISTVARPSFLPTGCHSLLTARNIHTRFFAFPQVVSHRLDLFRSLLSRDRSCSIRPLVSPGFGCPSSPRIPWSIIESLLSTKLLRLCPNSPCL